MKDIFSRLNRVHDRLMMGISPYIPTSTQWNSCVAEVTGISKYIKIIGWPPRLLARMAGFDGSPIVLPSCILT